jgi:predicted RNase H-like nuclease (RuvC/YqgF family)
MELQNEISYKKSVLKRHEDAVRALTEENCKLREKVSEQSREISKLQTESMYAFILFMY